MHCAPAVPLHHGDRRGRSSEVLTLRIATINFFTRGVRFIILGMLAIKYGKAILKMADSPLFRGIMIGFIVLCIAGSAFSIYGWLKNVRTRKTA